MSTSNNGQGRVCRRAPLVFTHPITHHRTRTTHPPHHNAHNSTEQCTLRRHAHHVNHSARRTSNRAIQNNFAALNWDPYPPSKTPMIRTPYSPRTCAAHRFMPRNDPGAKFNKLRASRPFCTCVFKKPAQNSLPPVCTIPPPHPVSTPDCSGRTDRASAPARLCRPGSQTIAASGIFTPGLLKRPETQQAALFPMLCFVRRKGRGAVAVLNEIGLTDVGRLAPFVGSFRRLAFP